MGQDSVPVARTVTANTPHQPRFVRCRACGLWVGVRSEQCAMCGIAWPTSRWLALRQESGLHWRDVTAVVGGLAGLVSGSVLFGLWQTAVRQGAPGPLRFAMVVAAGATGFLLGRVMGTFRLALGIAVGSLLLAVPMVSESEILRTWPGTATGTALIVLLGSVGWLAGRVLGPMYAESTWEARRPRSVDATRDDLDRRERALEHSLQQVKALGTRMAQENPHNPALEPLRATYHATEAALHRLAVDKWQVRMAIWQNEVQPIVADWRRLNAREAEAAVATLDRTAQTGRQLAQGWQTDTHASDPRGQRVIADMERLVEAVERLREAVLLRQAVALAQESPGALRAGLPHDLPIEAQGQIEQLRQGAMLSEVSSSQAELAAEKERLWAEEAAARDLEELLK